MKRITTTLIAAVAGSSGGYVLHQILGRKDEPGAANQLIVGAPLTVLLAAALLGILAGKRGPALSLAAGFVASVLLGTRLDDAIPGVSDARSRAVAKIQAGRSEA